MGDVGSLKSISGIKHQVQPERRLPPELSEPITSALETIQASCKAYKKATEERGEENPLLGKELEAMKRPPLKRKIQGPPRYVPPKGVIR